MKGKCPNCGAQVSSKPVRQIRMKDGQMRTVPADEVKRRKKKNTDSEQSMWAGLVFMAHNYNKKQARLGKKNRMSLDNARGMYRKKTGREPRPDMWLVPKDPKDWKRQPGMVFRELK